MKDRKNCVMKRVISNVIVLLSVLLSCVPALASGSQPQVLNIASYSTEEAVSYQEDSRFSFTYENQNDYQTIIYDEQFISDDGNIYDVEGTKKPYVLCNNHTYKSGTYSKHKLLSNGGCNVKNYDCDRCTECETLKIGGLISELNYTKCPH